MQAMSSATLFAPTACVVPATLRHFMYARERERDLGKDFDGDVDERVRRVVMDVEFECCQPRARV